MKRTILPFIALCLVLAAVFSSCKDGGAPSDTGSKDSAADTAAASPSAGYGELTDGFYKYTVSDNGAAITAYTGPEAKLVIPEKLGGFVTCEIKDSVFKKKTQIESITIPDGVKKIGSNAFAQTSAADIEIPDSVCEIGSGAFASTPWFEAQTDEFVFVGDGVCIKYNGTDSSVTIPGEAKFVSNLFRYSNTDIVSVTLSDGIVTVGERAFAGLKKLKSVTFSSTVEEIGSNAFTLCTALEEIALPDNIKSLGAYAFSHCKALRFAEIGSGVASLPASLFFSCSSLSEVVLPSQLRSIGIAAFDACPSLEKITVPSNVEEIGDGAFESGSDVKIYCEKNSFAEKYFTERGFSVNPDD